MKRLLILMAIIIISSSLFGCIETKKIEEAYDYNGKTDFTVDGRSFKLEDLPENIAEEIVVNNFLYSITADFENMSNIVADIEPHNISIENSEKNFNDGIYMKSYIIHEVSTLSEEEYRERETENGEQNPIYYYGMQKVIEKYNLIEYKIINVNFTQTHSERSNELVPQWGDGTYYRNFIVGKSPNDSSYKIYDFGMM